MNKPQNMFRLDSLRLDNFRCFAKCDVEFHPELTVLVAENGQGKTALLDAISHALNVFVSPMVTGRVLGGLALTDIRHKLNGELMAAELPASFAATGEFAGTKIEWSRSVFHARARPRSSRRRARQLSDAAVAMQRSLTTEQGTPATPTTLPAVLFYNTNRLQIDRSRRMRSWPARQDLGRRVAYLDCLAPHVSFQAFTKWFEKRWELAGSPLGKYAPAEEQPHIELAAVRSAVAEVLKPTGWKDLVWQKADPEVLWRQQGCLVGKHPAYGEVPLRSLSDGVRNMMAMVGDLAHRCVRLNPHFGENAARKTPGILLIDEVDMHLHPSWQQLVISLLRKTFPNLQLILSTHSPHVLSTIDFTSVRVIEIDADGIGHARSPAWQTRGDESGNVLARAMHVDPVPNVGPARLLSEYRALVQNGLDRSEQAQTIWRQLVSHFGDGHHLLHEAAVLRDLQEFKREYNPPAGGTP